MMKYVVTIVLNFFSVIAFGQLNYWSETNREFSSSGTNYTKIQLAEHSWGGSHALLFNAYRSITVDGNLEAIGNTKYANDGDNNRGGAGAIMFLGNSGIIDFLISPLAGSTGGDTDIDWGTPKMRIFRSGEVIIGSESTDPAGYMLSVAGKIRATQVKVEALPWPDYVFTPNYKLMSLQNLENYIESEGHLPNVPKAEEVAQEGIELGAMNAKLLEKIEELTLYIIEQNKQLEAQKARIEALEAKQ